MKKSLVTVLLMTLWVSAPGVKAKPSDEIYAKMNRICLETNVKSSAVYNTSCYQYIRGFLKGALVTESTIAKGLITGEFDSEFVNKTGLTEDSDWRKAVHMSGYTSFCLPSDEVTHDVVVSLQKGV